MARNSKINVLPTSAAHLEVTGRPLSSPSPQPQPTQFIPGRGGGSRTPLCRTPPWPQPPYLPTGGGLPSLLPSWLSFCCPLSPRSPQVPPRTPLSWGPPHSAHFQACGTWPPPKPVVTTSAHRASPIWSSALTSHQRPVRHPPISGTRPGR